MKLESLSLANCRGFEQLDINFESDVTLIAGVNGVGKSTVLRALVVLLSRAMPEFTPSRSVPLYFTDDDIYNDKAALNILAQIQIRDQSIYAAIQRLRSAESKGDRFVTLQTGGANTEPTDFAKSLKDRTLTGDLQAGSKLTRSTFAQLKNSSRHPLAVYFSPKRQLSSQPRTLPDDTTLSPSVAYWEALDDREVNLRYFMHWFRIQEKLGISDEPRRLKILNALICVVNDLIPEFNNMRVQDQPRLGFLVDKCGKPFYLHQLSDGERGLLALVFDLTRRLAIANPDSDDPIAEGVALVLIDEIELHLHPKWQRDVMIRLPKIFKSCQFVITTHSPQVLGEVPAHCVRLLIPKDGRVVVETPAMSYGVDSNWILNVLMGADEMDQDVSRELEDISRLIQARELKTAKAKISFLRNNVGNTVATQKLASLLERIERLGR
jgi:predicted ATP-binding protein involved in virulence